MTCTIDSVSAAHLFNCYQLRSPSEFSRVSGSPYRVPLQARGLTENPFLHAWIEFGERERLG
jgi:hypothetical protein